MEYIASEIIKRKKLGGEHPAEEIKWLVGSFVSGLVTDYQMSAWAMAVWFNGMTDSETAAFTRAMLESGNRFNFSKLNAPRIDKHSTGGVGDKTSLIIGPILAAAKVHVPMIAGRGLGHTGGTLDKLESLKGFSVDFSVGDFSRLIQEHFFGLMGQTEDICPADRKLYALRDVTSTIDSLPLICGSIMSKKLAEDLTGLVLDVKFGSGAFMKTVNEAEQLARLLKTTGERNGVRVTALLTNMNQPLGKFIGNALEVHECYEILSGKKSVVNGQDYYADTRELSLALAGHMIFLAEKSSTPEDGIQAARQLLESGRAREEFLSFLQRQGAAPIETLTWSKKVFDFKSKSAGYLVGINTEALGLAGIELGAGRHRAADVIDSSTGIEVCCRLGDQIAVDQPLLRLYYESENDLQSAISQLNSAFTFSTSPQNDLLPLIAKVII